MRNQKAKSTSGTPLLLRFLLALAVIGILFTLLPSGRGVAYADYPGAPSLEDVPTPTGDGGTIILD